MKTQFTVHAVAVNEDGECLILQRAEHRSSPGTWNFVTGYIKEKESAEDAAKRELLEETGLAGNTVKTTEPYWVVIGEVRWVVVASLIQVTEVSSLKIDTSESQSYKWVRLGEYFEERSSEIELTAKKLGLL